MIILIAIVLIETMLLGLTIWSARRVTARARLRLPRRFDNFPHAL